MPFQPRWWPAPPPRSTLMPSCASTNSGLTESSCFMVPAPYNKACHRLQKYAAGHRIVINHTSLSDDWLDDTLLPRYRKEARLKNDMAHKTIGLIGGVGPRSTAAFYQELVRRYARRAGGDQPAVLIHSVPMTAAIEAAI